MNKIKKNIDCLMAPFYIIKEEPSYVLWLIFMIFFGLINVFGGVLQGNSGELNLAFCYGQFYTLSIAMNAPFIVTYLLETLITKRHRGKQHFVKYKIRSMSINFLWIMCLTFLWTGNSKSSASTQLVVFLISLSFSFYMFCISEMQNSTYLLDNYDDSYLGNENEVLRSTQLKAEKLDHIENNEGRIDL